MEEYANSNRMMEIDIPTKEYRRLLDGGLDRLKRKCSPNLASRLLLQEAFVEASPSLLIFHKPLPTR
jgi:hypothetical protein